MSNPNPRSLIERAVSACILVLIGTLALRSAVDIVTLVWGRLAVLAAGVLVAGAALYVWQHHRNRW